MQITQKVSETEQEVAEGEVKDVTEPSNLTVDDLDDDSGFYQLVVRPMLNGGHEGELCEWLKEMGLLQRSMKCINSIDNKVCNSIMLWTPARIVDKFQWQCAQCNAKRTIRDKSCFKQIKCSFDVALRIILGWCKEMEYDNLIKILHCKPFIVKRVFELCSKLIDQYVQDHSFEFHLGGPSTVVVVHVYESLGENEKSRQYRNNNVYHPILYLAEVNPMCPRPKCWFHVLNTPPISNGSEEEIEKASKIEAMEVAEVVREFVRPGTSIVVDTQTVGAVKELLTGNDQYPGIVDTVQLSKFDRQDENCLAENLDEIWKSGLWVCDTAQVFPKNKVNNYLREQMWRQLLGTTPSNAFEYLMHHIADIWQEAN